MAHCGNYDGSRFRGDEDGDVYINNEVCSSCNNRFSCGQSKADIVIDELRDAAYITDVQNKALQEISDKFLKSVSGDNSLEAVLSKVSKTLSNSMKTNLENIYGQTFLAVAGKQLTDDVKREMNKIVVDIMNEDITLFNLTDDNTVSTIREMATSTIKKEICKMQKISNRDIDQIRKEALHSIIKDTIGSQVKEVIADIRSDCIDYYNAEMMKTMMSAMGREISNNPHLLAMINAEKK